MEKEVVLLETIVLFDPGIRSLNKGDEIIMRSEEKELSAILEDSYVIKCATHAPVLTCYQNTNLNPRMRVYHNAKYKFVCGSNLLWRNMLKPRPAWNINLFNNMPYRNSILLGVGTDSKENKTNWYTKYLYSQILSREYIHSVRDEETENLLNSLGYSCINTGCPTMWGFTSEFCSMIPHRKAESVVFTLTDYCRDPIQDQLLINILKENYTKVYFWVQGVFDKEYFDSLNNTQDIVVIPPSVEAFSRILHKDDIDYVGTRLHAGMFALQHKKRTIILAIDNRARDMCKSYDLNVIERSEIERLSELIKSDVYTDVKINRHNIEEWLSQFDCVEIRI